MGAMLLLVKGGQLRRGRAYHHTFGGFHYRHLQSVLDRDRRHFEPDIAAPHNREARAGRKMWSQPIHIVDPAQIINARKIGPGHRHLAHARARRQQKLVIAKSCPVGETHRFCPAIDAGRRHVQPQIARSIGVKGVGFQEQPFPREVPGKIGFGQRRPLIGRKGFIPDQREGAAKSFEPEGRGSLHACLPRADDNDPLHCPVLNPRLGG